MTFADKRVEKWPLMSSPLPTVAISAAYVLMCIYGPRVMEKRSDTLGNNLRPLIVVYNFLIAALNLYMGLELLATSLLLGSSWLCEPVDYSDNPISLRVASVLWWYYFSKLIEMLDSVFFILKKKWDQLSFLHSSMFCLWWIGIKFVAGGSSFLPAMFNCFVHVVMYGYYMVAALGPAYRKWLWWKKYLTIVQMVQFFVIMLITINTIRMDCDFIMWMMYGLLTYMISFLLLFSHFFYNAYSLKKVQ